LLPNLIIVGAMKCATSSLHYYLGLHPEIKMSKKKELDFFIFERNWDKGITWYESQFSGKAKVYGESSTNYTKYPWFKGVPQRMYSIIPNAKLIYILRDPIERIVSEYIHIYSEGGDRRTIKEALTNLKDNWYVDNSKYYMQLEQYLNFYPKSNFLIMTAEDLQMDTQRVLAKAFRFLNVDGSFFTHSFFKRVHTSKDKKAKNRLGRFLAREVGHRKAEDILLSVFPYTLKKAYLRASRKKAIEKPKLDENTRQNLKKSLEDDVNKLRKYTGCSFENWSI
jgi:Sulfotransferase domain